MVGKCPQEVVEDRWAAEEECEGQDSVWIMTWVTHPWVEATGLACAVAAADSAVAHPVSAEEVSVWDSETVNGKRGKFRRPTAQVFRGYWWRIGVNRGDHHKR